MEERDTKKSTHSCYMDEHTRYKVTYLTQLLGEGFVRFYDVLKLETTTTYNFRTKNF